MTGIPVSDEGGSGWDPTSHQGAVLNQYILVPHLKEQMFNINPTILKVPTVKNL